MATALYIQAFHAKDISVEGPVFAFQEEARCRTARTWKDSDPDCQSGWTAIVHMQKMYTEKEWQSRMKYEEEFQALCAREFFSCKHPANVRAQVKRIWTSPLKGFLTWNDLSEAKAQPIVAACREIVQAEGTRPSIQIVHGKVYLMLPGFIGTLWAKKPELANALIDDIKTPLRANTEASHITVVNSDVVTKCDHAKIQELVAQYAKAEVDLTCTKVSHTVSLDWAPFGVCLAVHMQSTALTNFLTDFNRILGQTVRIPSSFHVTVAVVPRT